MVFWKLENSVSINTRKPIHGLKKISQGAFLGVVKIHDRNKAPQKRSQFKTQTLSININKVLPNKNSPLKLS